MTLKAKLHDTIDRARRAYAQQRYRGDLAADVLGVLAPSPAAGAARWRLRFAIAAAACLIAAMGLVVILSIFDATGSTPPGAPAVVDVLPSDVSPVMDDPAAPPHRGQAQARGTGDDAAAAPVAEGADDEEALVMEFTVVPPSEFSLGWSELPGLSFASVEFPGVPSYEEFAAERDSREEESNSASMPSTPLSTTPIETEPS